MFITCIGYYVGSIALFPLLKVLEKSTVINLYLISTLKGTTKATTEDVLKLNTLKGTKTAGMTTTPVISIWESPPGRESGGNQAYIVHLGH